MKKDTQKTYFVFNRRTRMYVDAGGKVSKSPKSWVSIQRIYGAAQLSAKYNGKKFEDCDIITVEYKEVAREDLNKHLDKVRTAVGL